MLLSPWVEKSSCHVTFTFSSKDTSLLPTSISLLYNSLLLWISSSLQPSHISSLKQHLSTLSGSLSSKSPIKQKEYCYHTLRVRRWNNGAIRDEVLIQRQQSPFDLLLSVTRTAKSKKISFVESPSLSSLFLFVTSSDMLDSIFFKPLRENNFRARAVSPQCTRPYPTVTKGMGSVNFNQFLSW